MPLDRKLEKVEKQITVTQYKTEDGRVFDTVSEANGHHVWLDRKDYLTEKFYEEMMELNKDGKLFPYGSYNFKTIDDYKDFIWIRLSKNEQSAMGYVSENGKDSHEFDEDMPFDYGLWDTLKYIMVKKYGYDLSIPYYYWGK